MKTRTLLTNLSCFLSIIICSSGLASASDAIKEQRIAEQTIASLFDGDPIWLKTKSAQEAGDGTQFLALYSKGNQDRPAIILLHGTGQGPDTPFVIAPLRERFAELDYSTLSLQMPVLTDGDQPEDYLSEFGQASERISAGINFLNSKKPKSIIVIAHSLGSSMMMNWAVNGGMEDVDALVALGFGGVQGFDALAVLDTLKIPVLDVIGERDYKTIILSAPLRSSRITATNAYSTQATIEQADHFYNHKEQELVDLIASWLAQLN